MLRKEFDWYTKIVTEEDFSVNSIAEIQERAPKWHPSPRPNFSLTSEETQKIQEDATRRFERCKAEVIDLCTSEKHRFSETEEILTTGKFNRRKYSTDNQNQGTSKYRALPCPCTALPYSVLSCPAMPCPVLPCPALPCPALPCPALVLPCPALPWPGLPRPFSDLESIVLFTYNYIRRR